MSVVAIRRSPGGDLFVTGPTLERMMFRSADGGRSWSGHRYDLGMERFDLKQMPRDSEAGWVGAFEILDDGSFLLNVMPSNHRRNSESYLARSGDGGVTWTVERAQLPLGDHRSVAAGNSDMIQLSDGTLLLTMDHFFYLEMEEEKELPVEQRGVFAHLLRSGDGGVTWPEKSPLTMHGAEVHLLELPSGKLLSAIRKQRNIRLPGDPEDIEAEMRANGYDPEYSGFVEPVDEETARVKSVFLSESGDAGRTWVNERRVTGYEQCSGDLALLADGATLVLRLRQPLPRPLRPRRSARPGQLRRRCNLGAGGVHPRRRGELPGMHRHAGRKPDHDLPVPALRAGPGRALAAPAEGVSMRPPAPGLQTPALRAVIAGAGRPCRKARETEGIAPAGKEEADGNSR